MHTAARRFIVLGALLLACATGLGAWAAHGLENLIDSDSVATFRIGVEYHFFHALGILVTAMLLDRLPNSRLLLLCGVLLTAGIVLFSGSLYLLAFDTARFLGPVTPLGGVSFIAGWLCLAAALWRARAPDQAG
ncbi:MAG TPA: DUF423 domain-containing protein [Gammaproteobacteria bacterium]|nr:DUF423 domain-containing protein [Gammaproteobacteria bacterium]